MLKRYSVLAWIVPLIAGPLGSVQTEWQVPRRAVERLTVDQILDRYEAALGGREAWDRLTSRVIKGTMVVSGSGQEISVEVYQQLPNRYLNISTLPSGVKTEIGFNGEIGWSRDSIHGVRRLTGLQLVMLKHSADFNETVDLRRAFPHMELLGTSLINGRTTYAIQTTTAEGDTGKMYFDAENGFRVRITSTGANGQTYDAYIEEYCNLKDVGIKYPCRQHEVWPTYNVTVQVTEIRHNIPIDSSLFVPPSFAYKIQR